MSSVPRFFVDKLRGQRLNLTLKSRPMNPFKLRDDYTFEELLFLKCLAKFPEDSEFAAELINKGQGEYNWNRLDKMTERFMEKGLIDFSMAHIGTDDKTRTIFDKNIRKKILNTPNPIPENMREGISVFSLLEKLQASNLDFSEIGYISTLVKKDIIDKP